MALFYLYGSQLQAPSPAASLKKKKVKFQVCFYQSLTDNMVFLNGLIEHKKVKRTKLMLVFRFLANGFK